jgi:pyruvyltransferase
MGRLNRWKLEKNVDDICCIGLAAIKRNGVKVYWWRSRKNFGDLITPALLKYYGYTPIYKKESQAELISTGSIIDGLKENYGGIILGSGLIKDSYKSLPNAKVLALRGELTKNRLGVRKDIPLGDPGLLARNLVCGVDKKTYSIGVIPHYMDKDDPCFLRFCEKYKDEILLISVERSPELVFKDILSCERILSSSLHGIITAHALAVPAAWLEITGKLTGGDFKFLDYFSSLSINMSRYKINESSSLGDLDGYYVMPSMDLLEERFESLDSVFKSLSYHII